MSNDRPVPSSSGVSHRMSRARRRDTEPEMLIRREAHRRGLRYRVDKAIPGMPRRRADMIFAGAKVAVFVDGCFWHSCPEHLHLPKANREWWEHKLASIRARDADVTGEYAEHGWCVLRVWEHEDPQTAADRVEALVRARRASG